MTFCLASVTTKPAGLRSASFLMTCPTIPLKPPSSVGRPHAPSGGVSAGKERQEIERFFYLFFIIVPGQPKFMF